MLSRASVRARAGSWGLPTSVRRAAGLHCLPEPHSGEISGSHPASTAAVPLLCAERSRPKILSWLRYACYGYATDWH